MGKAAEISSRESSLSKRCGLTNAGNLQLNLSKVHQAPWDRDDVHHKVLHNLLLEDSPYNFL